MAFTLAGRTTGRVAVVGSGNMGPDVALFFARRLARHGVSIVLHDVSRPALEAGRGRILEKFRRGSETGVFRAGDTEAVERSITFTQDRSLLMGCDLVVEAVTEDLGVKQAVFEEIERLISPQAILASTTSHLEPERIFERLRRPERALVHHFFYPAERNPLIEIVSGPKTAVAGWCLRFYEAMGKVPVESRGRYGYSVNPIFEGLFLASMLLEEKGFSPAIIDAVACRAFGATAGPFTVVNLAGGNLITRESLGVYHEKIMPWFRSPAPLEERGAGGGPWRTSDRGETVNYSNQMYEEISRSLLAVYFGLACEAAESGIASIADLEIAAELGLALKPPFAMMNELGPRAVRGLIESYAAANPGFKVPAAFGPWAIPTVLREDRDGVAVLTIRRPKTLNAITPDVFAQIGRELDRVKDDPAIRGVVITGFGTKAFASGADLATLSAISGPEDARGLSASCSGVLRRLETLGKPVVCALNGLSLGGGSELAYACTARIAMKGLPVLFGQPEVRLGLIPGAGATQRLPRLVDFATAWRILRTGGTLSGAEARQLGLVLEEVDGDLVARAVELARTIPPAPPPEPRVPSVLPEVDLKGLSRRLDEILRRAIVDGAKLPIDQGLALESACFAEVFTTRDHRIGLDNFLKFGTKQPARFVHA
jgi:enoyl-CoA hydratase/3-hydroxyacyl-CoA dehydrogenase